MAPDLNHGTSNQLASNEALVPWSMFGETKEQAEAFLEEMNKKGGIPFIGSFVFLLLVQYLLST